MSKEDRCYVDFLNKSKNFTEDRKYFETYELAERWCKDNFEKYHPDMIGYAGVTNKENE